MSLSGGGVAVMSSFFQCHDKNRDEARCKLEAPDEVQAQRQTQAHPTYVSAGVTMVVMLVSSYVTLWFRINFCRCNLQSQALPVSTH